MCLSDHDGFEYVLRAGAMDALADVFLWNDRLPGRDSFPERNSEGEKAGFVYLRLFKRISDLRRDHESGIHSDGIRQDHEEEPDRILYFRCTCGSGTGHVYGDLSVDLKQAVAGEAGEGKEKIRAFTEPGEKGGR